MRYEGPIYRPPSEADSLLIQATIGCPHNRCSFCMVYKKGPRYRVRPFGEIEQDLQEAARRYGSRVRTLFLPAGNTIAMPTAELAAVCRRARELLPELERITVYGSAQYIHRKGAADCAHLRRAGLSRIHVGLESGSDEVLRRIKKGANRQQQIEAGTLVREAGMELSEYVMIGIGGLELSEDHALATAAALNRIQPHFVRLRTLVPKVNTLLLHQIEQGRFQLLGPHQALTETRLLISRLEVPTRIVSDHYTNYVNLEGRIPEDQERLLAALDHALERPQSAFRPHFVGTE